MSSKISRRDWIIGMGLGAAVIAAASGLYTARDDIAHLLGSSKPAAGQSGLEDAVIKPKQQVLEITWDNYENIINSGKPVFIEFYADGCPPCRAIDPAYKDVALKSSDDVIFARCKCYTRPDPPLVNDWDLHGVPKIALAHDGGLLKIIGGLELVPMRGENGAAAFQQIVKSALEQYNLTGVIKQPGLERYVKQALPEQLTELTPDNYQRIIYSGTPVVIEVYSGDEPDKKIAQTVRKVSEFYSPEQVLFTRCEFTRESRHPLLTDWGINEPHRVILAYKGGLKEAIWGDGLLPVKGENGAAAFQQMVEKGLEKYCGDYLDRDR